MDVPHRLAPADVTVDALATFIAAHAIVLLLASSALALVAAALVWNGIERGAPRLLGFAAPLWRRIDRRRIAARYLGLQALVFIAVAAVGAMIFVELADEIAPDEDLGQFDLALSMALRESLSATTLRFFSLLTHLGDFEVLAPLVAVSAALLFWRRHALLASTLLFTTTGAALLNDGLKRVFERARPEFVHEFAHVSGFSFPSGHSAGSLAVYGTLAYVAVRLLPRRWHLTCVAFAMTLIVFVGASRVLLQVHFFSDVLGGWAGAATWTSLCVAALEAWRLSGVRRAAAPAQ
ncbi:MAG: phosphatase PAP2 family protein [Steroidobacteraceae bacterium]